MIIETSIDQLVCEVCNHEARPKYHEPAVDYQLREIEVTRKDGTKVTVPIDVTDCVIKYKAGRKSIPVRILARVPCPSCGTDHTINASDIMKAPLLALREITCPRCDHTVEIVEGPTLHYTEKTPCEGWVKVSAITECPHCRLKADATGGVTAQEFQSAQASGALEVSVSVMPPQAGTESPARGQE